MNPEARAEVIGRDLYCGWCAKRIVHPAVHHRRLRSQGGDDAVDNLVALCADTCHNVASTSVHQNVAEAIRRGFIVPSWATPAETPLLLATGATILLSSVGYTIVSQGDSPWATPG